MKKYCFLFSFLVIFLSFWVSSSYGVDLDLSSASRYARVTYKDGVLKLQEMYGVKVSAGYPGYPYVMVRMPDGTVFAQGSDNSMGQLGNGSFSGSYFGRVKSPDGQGYLSDIVSVAVGGYAHTLALKSDGTVWAWGNNDRGQLGVGDFNNRSLPVQVLGLSNIVAIAAGNQHSLALRSDGTVWAWGDNAYGQLGDGTTSTRTTPVQVKDSSGQFPLQNITAIQAGFTASFALTASGYVYSWGDNRFSELCRSTQSSYPNMLPGFVTLSGTPLGGVSEISASSSYHLTMFRMDDGSVRACGENTYGQLGQGSTGGYTTTPVKIKNSDGSGYLDNVVSIASGGNHALALKSDGTVWAWGKNGSGQLGDNTTNDKSLPVQVKGQNGVGFFEGVSKVFAGPLNSYALKSDGSFWAWGHPNCVGTYFTESISTVKTPVHAFTGYAGISTGVSNISSISIDASDGIGYRFSSDGTNYYFYTGWWQKASLGYQAMTKQQVASLGASQWAALPGLNTSKKLYILALYQGQSPDAFPSINRITINMPWIDSFSFLGDKLVVRSGIPESCESIPNGGGRYIARCAVLSPSGVGSWELSASSFSGSVAYQITLPDSSVVNSGRASYTFTSPGTYQVKGKAYLVSNPSVYREETITVKVPSFYVAGAWGSASSLVLSDVTVLTNGEPNVGFLFSAPGPSGEEDSDLKKWGGSSWVMNGNLQWDPTLPGWIEYNGGLHFTSYTMTPSEVNALGRGEWELLAFRGDQYSLFIWAFEDGSGRVERIDFDILDSTFGYVFPQFSLWASLLSGQAPHTVVFSAEAEGLREVIKQLYRTHPCPSERPPVIVLNHRIADKIFTSRSNDQSSSPFLPCPP
jgi:alpha-tubulin suppressor-like RCC1 family protein